MKNIIFLGLMSPLFGYSAEPSFRMQEIDAKVGVGYGLQLADMDGDKKKDIILCDKDKIVWYQNPSWKKHQISGHLTKRDHVCVTARDLDGDGKAEIAVGGQWNIGDLDTVIIR